MPRSHACRVLRLQIDNSAPENHCYVVRWVNQGVVSEDKVMETMKRMAAVVDRQNAGDPNRHPHGPACDGMAFKAACDRVFEGRVQPSGYTEPILHRRRLELKAQQG